MKNINPTNTQAWKALEAHQSQLANTTIADLFKQEQNRFNDYSLNFENKNVSNSTFLQRKRVPEAASA